MKVLPPTATTPRRRFRFGCLWLTLFGLAVFGSVLFFFFPRIRAFVPYPEWMPIRESSLYTFGIDVSHYQETIRWEEVQQSHHPIAFVFARATMGVDGRDSEFARNWEGAQRAGLLRGAYHYYRPNENSTAQFENFKQVVRLDSGDLPPVLDVEAMSMHGRDNLRKGVRNWVTLCEAHYGVKPIIYSGRTFYLKNLVGAVDGCPLWIAAYSGKHRVSDIDWMFHQFTERVRVRGIRGNVDGNDFYGTLEELRALALP